MKRNIFNAIILLLINFLCINSIYATVGKTGWLIFRKVQSPKPKSITTVAAVRGDISGVLYNPAILATIESKELFTMAELGITEDKLAGVIYGHPLSKSGISVGVINYNTGKDVLYWIQDGQEKYKEVTLQNDYLGFVSYGRQIKDRIFLGATVKFATTQIVESIKSTAYAVDIGGSYFIKNIVISLAGQNIGVSQKFVEKEEKLPMSAYIAIGYSGILDEYGDGYYYMVGCDAAYLVDEERLIPAVGVEIGKNPIGIFVGYRANVNEGSLNVGLSFSFKSIDLGYTYIPATYLKTAHRVSLGVKF